MCHSPAIRSWSVAVLLVDLLVTVVHCNSLKPLYLNFSLVEEVPLSYIVVNLITELRSRGIDAAGCSTRSDLFLLSPTGELQPARRLDRETICAQAVSTSAASPAGSPRIPESSPCIVSVSALCALNDSNVQVVKLALKLNDINDNPPSWSEKRYELKVPESVGSQLPQPLRVPFARDADSGRNALVQYALTGPDRNLFQLTTRPDALSLQLKTQIDREQRDVLRVAIEATDQGSPALNGSLEVLIRVLDMNDHVPQFVGTPYRVAVAETVGVDTVIFTLSAVDNDSEANGRVKYRFSELADASARQLFEIDESSGRVTLVGQLDYETSRSHQLHVVAVDGGPIAHTSETTLVVDVTDVNDNAVTINFTPSMQAAATECSSEAHLCVEENVKPGTWLATVFAEDRDAGDNDRITCRSETLLFNLVPLYVGSTREFNLSVAKVTLDREANERHIAIISCSDNGQSPSSTLTIRVDLLDVNDNAPRFERLVYNASVLENSPPRREILQLRAVDPDAHENGRITYYLHPNDSEARRFVEVTTQGLLLTAGSSFDREVMSSFRFRVVAVDAGRPSPLSATAIVELSIVDVNDVPPLFELPEYTFRISEELPPVCIGSVHAQDGDADVFRGAPVGYRLGPPTSADSYDARDDFEIHGDSGRICTRRPFDRERQAEFLFTVLAVDNPVNVAEKQMTATVSVRVFVDDVNDHAPVFVFPNAANRTVNVSLYAQAGTRIAFVQAIDGDFAENGTVTYSLQHRTLDFDRQEIFGIDKHSGEIILLKPLQSLENPDSSTIFLHRLHKLYITARDGGKVAHESSQSLDVMVDFTVRQEQDDQKNGAGIGGTFITDHPQFVLVVMLSILALVFLILLIIVISCALNRNCCMCARSKRSTQSQRRRMQRSLKDPADADADAYAFVNEQERNLIPPPSCDTAATLSIHCLNSPLNRSFISASSANDNQSVYSANVPKQDFYGVGSGLGIGKGIGMGTLRRDGSNSNTSSPVKQQQQLSSTNGCGNGHGNGNTNTNTILSASPSLNALKKNNIDLIRHCNIPYSCPTSPPLEANDDADAPAPCDSEMRAFTPKAFNTMPTACTLSIRSPKSSASHAHQKTFNQPSTVNLKADDSPSAQRRMYTFSKGGKSSLATHDVISALSAAKPRRLNAINDEPELDCALHLHSHTHVMSMLTGNTCICGSPVAHGNGNGVSQCKGASCSARLSIESNDSNNNTNEGEEDENRNRSSPQSVLLSFSHRERESVDVQPQPVFNSTLVRHGQTNTPTHALIHAQAQANVHDNSRMQTQSQLQLQAQLPEINDIMLTSSFTDEISAI